MEPMPSNQPDVDSKHRSSSWFSVWIKIVSSPKEQTILEIVEDPNLNPNRAFVWVFVAGMVPIVIAGIIQSILAIAGLDEQFVNNPEIVSGAVSDFLPFFVYACVSPLFAIIVVVIFGLSVGCVQLIAKLLGGTGTFEKLVYILGAIVVPFVIVSIIVLYQSFGLAFVNTPVLVRIWLIELLLIVFTLALSGLAIKTVNRFGWFQAGSLTLLLGLSIVSVFGCCLFFGIFGAA